jgi:phytoene dehydrogenase-like protein
MADATFDAIVIGAGHNGLVAANYLAMAGLKVAVLESRAVVGGACVTEELIPGAKFSSCAFVQGTFRPEIVDELGLRDHGLEMTAPEVQGFAIFPDGSHLFLWKDLDRTIRELEKVSPPDAKGFVEFALRLRRFGQIMRPFIFCTTPPRRSEVMAAFDKAGEAELYNEFVLGSVRSLLEKYFISEHIKGFLTLYGLVSIWAGPDTPEGAYLYGYHATGEFEQTTGRWAFVKGGMGGITQALARAATARGVHIRTAAPVSEILIENGRAVGVRLESGDTQRAETVLSNAHPKLTFLKLIKPSHLQPRFKEAIERIDTRGAMARVHLLVDRLPHYVGFDSDNEGWQHRGHAVLGCSIVNFQEAHRAQLNGTFPEELAVELIIQSVSDPSLAPPGRHTITMGVQHTPIELAKGDWDSRKEEWGDLVCETLLRYAPNLRGHILGRHIITPLDLQRRYNLIGGNIFHVQMTLEYAFDSRPTPVVGGYRTAIQGLYLCGAGTHPGGAVTGAPGRNAAHAVLEDRSGSHADLATFARLPNRAFADRLMDNPTGAKLGRAALRSALLRPLTRHFIRNRPK